MPKLLTEKEKMALCGEDDFRDYTDSYTPTDVGVVCRSVEQVERVIAMFKPFATNLTDYHDDEITQRLEQRGWCLVQLTQDERGAFLYVGHAMDEGEPIFELTPEEFEDDGVLQLLLLAANV